MDGIQHMYWSLNEWDPAHPCNVLEPPRMGATLVMYYSLCRLDAVHPGNVLEHRCMGCSAPM